MAREEDFLSIHNSKEIKRSKLMYIGLKPQKDKEDILTSLIINDVKQDFQDKVISLENISFLDFLFKKENLQTRKNIINEFKERYLDQNPFENLFFWHNVSLEFLQKNNKKYRYKYANLIDKKLSIQEIEKLPTALDFKIVTRLAKYSYKPFIKMFLEFLLKKEPIIENWLIFKKNEINIRNNKQTRELTQYSNYLYILKDLKKQNIMNKYLDYLEDFEVYCFDRNYSFKEYNKKYLETAIKNIVNE